MVVIPKDLNPRALKYFPIVSVYTAVRNVLTFVALKGVLKLSKSWCASAPHGNEEIFKSTFPF